MTNQNIQGDHKFERKMYLSCILTFDAKQYHGFCWGNKLTKTGNPADLQSSN